MAESGGLENRCPGNWTVGSNPTLSAMTACCNMTPEWSHKRKSSPIRGWDSNRGGSWGGPLRGERTRELTPSVGARAETASATSNAHPLRHYLARQIPPVHQPTGYDAPEYQQVAAANHRKGCRSANRFEITMGPNLVRARLAWPVGCGGEYGSSECRRAEDEPERGWPPSGSAS